MRETCERKKERNIADREEKKKLITAIQGSKERITSVLDELRKHSQNLRRLDNATIAKLNN